ncbi:MAG: DinB family protein [Blastocatellia bacterium]
MALSKKVQELADTMARIRESLLKHVSGLSDEQLNYKPEDGAWSVNDILHHLALTDEANGKLTSRALKHAKEKNVPSDPTPDESVLHCLDEAVAPLDNTRVQAPEFVRPQAHLSAPDSLARLAESRKRMLESVEQLSHYDLTQLKYPHPFLGELDMYQWILIAGGHEGRHIAQIKRIKAEAGFPH